MVRNKVKNGQSWCLAVICRKRSVFDMQFHLIVVLIFLKTCVKDQGEKLYRATLIQRLLKPLNSSNKKKFWNVNFYISHMQCALRSEFRLIVISAIINRRLMTCALTFFLMIFFSNSGEPLMKFSFTNSSFSTSWGFLNPSSQKKKNELIFKTWYFPCGLIQACE